MIPAAQASGAAEKRRTATTCDADRAERTSALIVPSALQKSI
jgi:hypothetical protein